MTKPDPTGEWRVFRCAICPPPAQSNEKGPGLGSSALARGLMQLMSPVLLLVLGLSRAGAVEEEDLITSLPNLTFHTGFRQYSGYLQASSDGRDKFFYWLTEAVVDAASAPLLVWLNGGPGCSSVGGLLGEYGPFFVTKDGHHLVENPFSWNREFNVLFMESPVGVGFSYADGDPTQFNVGDDETAALNLHALHDFFARVQPRYRHRKWFLTGESYAGIYIPTLTNLVLEQMEAGKFPNRHFQGIAIGNGYVNAQNLTNSLVHWHVYHGAIGVREWIHIKKVCCSDLVNVEQCDFYKHIKDNSTMTWPLDECGKLFTDVLNTPEYQNEYNYYLDCYKSGRIRSTRTSFMQHSHLFTNFDTTDNMMGFPCWNEDAMTVYMNKRKVQTALHVSRKWMRHRETMWETCNDDMTDEYRPTYLDTFDLFQSVITKVIKSEKKVSKNFRILFFNGDVDTVCNFIGVAWHVDNVAQKAGFRPSRRTPWRFRGQIAGYVQRYSKGAGHFVSDRPGPALQMITNFVKGTGNYSRQDTIRQVMLSYAKNTSIARTVVLITIILNVII